MKHLFAILILSFPLLTFSQTYGSFRVQTFKNETNNLDDNYQLDTTTVRIINKRYSVDTVISFTETNRFSKTLRSGKYKLICSTRQNKDVVLEGVTISGDMITFIDILIEPVIDLNLAQRRKRRKQLYANYMKK